MNSSAQSQQLDELRTLLTRRFPEAHQCRAPEEGSPSEGDDPGMLPWHKGGLLEFVNAPGFGGGALYPVALIERLSAAGKNVTLIDGGQHFDPENLSEFSCQHLFWLRCKTLTEGIKATDWMLRDGNISAILLDLQFYEARDLQRLPTSLWFRFKQLAERRQSTLGIWTPFPLISGVTQRRSLENVWSLDALDEPQDELLKQLRRVAK